MSELSLQQLVLIVCVGLFTLAAAFCDCRSRKVPNRLTLPMFGIGWVYQLSFFGWSGLADAGLAFLIGFGVLFVLWLIGGGGGGDVKLMGALSIWLGYRMTLLVLLSSTALVIAGSMLVIVVSMIRRGAWKTKQKFVAESKRSEDPVGKNRPAGESLYQRKKRRIMAYALPVAVATWLVMIWKVPLM